MKKRGETPTPAGGEVSSMPAGVALVPRGVPGAKAMSKILGVRKDAPVNKEPGRGSLARALAAGFPQHRASALARPADDGVALSGKGGLTLATSGCSHDLAASYG